MRTGETLKNLAVVGALGVGAYAVAHYEFGVHISLPEVHWFDSLHYNDNASKPLTAEVSGGIVDVKTTPLETPLFDRTVAIASLLIKQGTNTKYEESSVSVVRTTMHGRVVAISRDEGGVKNVYVMGVNNNKTPDDPTDDKLVPINLNDQNVFTLYSGLPGKSRTYIDSASGPKDYNDCVAKLNAGDTDYQGCIESGLNGYAEAIKPAVLDNLRRQYNGDDQCLVDEVHAGSNNVLGGLTEHDKWNLIHENTVTVSDIAAASIRERVASNLAVPIAQVQVIMEMDGNKPVEWKPKNTVNLQEVEALSQGQYKAPDVEIGKFCLDGSWFNKSTAAGQTKTLQALIGPKLTDSAWLASLKYVPPAVIPKDLFGITFNKDGSYSWPAANSGTVAAATTTTVH